MVYWTLPRRMFMFNKLLWDTKSTLGKPKYCILLFLLSSSEGQDNSNKWLKGFRFFTSCSSEQPIPWNVMSLERIYSVCFGQTIFLKQLNLRILVQTSLDGLKDIFLPLLNMTLVLQYRMNQRRDEIGLQPSMIISGSAP